MEKVSEGPRFLVLDSWRGICALLVAVYHLQAMSHIFFVPLIRHSFLFVDFFFVLSGFVITHAYAERLRTGSELGVFVIRRFGRIWPLQAALLIAFVGVETLNLILAATIGLKSANPPFDPAGIRPLSGIPIHLFLLQAIHVTDRLTWNFPSWSISAEFATYLVFGAICLFFPRRKTWLLILAGGASASIIAIFSTRGIDVTFDLGCLRSLYGFAVGHLAYRLYQSGWRITGRYSAAAEIFVLLSVFFFVSIAGYGQLSMLAPVCFGAAVFVFSLEPGPVSKMLKTRAFELIGKWSFSIYMVHALILWVAFAVIQRVAGVSIFVEFTDAGGTRPVIAHVNPFLLDGLLVTYIAVTIGLAALTFRYVETPGRQAFGRLARSFSHRAATGKSPQPIPGTGLASVSAQSATPPRRENGKGLVRGWRFFPYRRRAVRTG